MKLFLIQTGSVKKKYLFLFLSFIIANTIVLGLYAYSRFLSISKSSFIRFMPPHVIKNFKYLDLTYNSYYLAGVYHDHIYLGNYTAPLKFLITDTNLENTKQAQIALADSQILNWDRARVKIEYPLVCLGDESSSKILIASFPALKLIHHYILDTVHFDHVWQPLSAGSVVLRKYDDQKKQNVLMTNKIDSVRNPNSSGVLEKQLDGKFCTDGSLLYDRAHSRLVYVYFYRNQFIVTDTNLHIISKFRTIDTISTAKISLDTIYAENRVTFSSPPVIINKRACIIDDWLLIHSGNLAANEEADAGNNNSDIDIYDLKNGQYLYSFAITQFRNQKVKGLSASGKKLILLYDSYLVTYDLNL